MTDPTTKPDEGHPATNGRARSLLRWIGGVYSDAMPVVLTLAFAIMAAQIAQSYKLAEDIGSIKERVQILIEQNTLHTSAIKDLQSQERQTWETLIANSGVLGLVSSNIDGIKRDISIMQNKYDDVDDLQLKVVGIAEMIRGIKADPIEILRQHGIQLVGGYAAASIEGQLFIFPDSKSALDELIKGGYQPTAITPAITGFSRSE
jgi:hypothetical protein